MTLKSCPIAYDHDDDECAACGWHPAVGDEPEPTGGKALGVEAWITALNGLIADRNCCAPPDDEAR